MNVDEIAEILGAETVARLQSAVKSAFVAARRHPDPETAEAALDRLLVTLAGAVIAHPDGLDAASARADDFCRELALVVAAARRIARSLPEAESPTAPSATPAPMLRRRLS